MLPTLLRSILLGTTRLFYREIAISGPDEPIQGPVVIVANHPNGLVDPILVRMAVGRPVGSLAKSTLFENPFGRAAMAAFDAVPMYRRKDGEDTSQNDSMFEACRQRLYEGGGLMLFPEGVSHSEPRLLELKTGAARIALQAEAQRDFELGVRVAPVGLIYEDKAVFRSRVAVVIGQPFEVADWRRAYEEDAYEAARALTHAIAGALGDVVLQARDEELWAGFLAVAGWIDPEAARDLEVRQARARQLAAGYQWLQEHEPGRAQQLVDEVRHFAHMFESIGVQDPLRVEAPSPGPARLAGYALWLVALAPLALVGFVLGWVPYRLIRPLSFAIARGDLDVVSSIKAIAGLVLMPLTYVLEAALAAYLWSWEVGLIVLVGAPLLGFVALRFGELVALRRDALRALWLRATKESTLRAVTARRQELAARLEGLLAKVPA